MAQDTTASKVIGVSKSYEYEVAVNPEQKMLCGKTGIEKKWKDLTDKDIEAMVAKGNKGFTKKGKTV